MDRRTERILEQLEKAHNAFVQNVDILGIPMPEKIALALSINQFCITFGNPVCILSTNDVDAVYETVEHGIFYTIACGNPQQISEALRKAAEIFSNACRDGRVWYGVEIRADCEDDKLSIRFQFPEPIA